MKKLGVRGEKQQIEEDLVLKEEKVYMPKDEELRVEIIQLHYNVLVAGYKGKWKMTKLVAKNYWQPRVIINVEKYVEGCNMCQKIKNRIEALAEKLKLSEVLEKPWTHLMVDFITKLLLVAGKDTILVVYNRLFKMTYFIAITEETSAEGLTRLFRGNIWKLHRFLEHIVSDRGLQFAAEMTKKLNRMLGIETKLSMLYHPQMDGQTERINQELEQYSRFFVNYR